MNAHTLLISKGVIINGHYEYPSGRHGDDYVDKHALFRDPELLETLGKELAEQFVDEKIDIVVARELLTAFLGLMVARLLNVPFIPATTSAASAYSLDNGDAELVNGKRVLVIDDVVDAGTTGRKVVQMLRRFKANVVGLGVVCNRGSDNPELVGNVPRYVALVQLSSKSWDAGVCKHRGPCSQGLIAKRSVHYKKK